MAKKNKIDWRIVVGGMVCITILELYALYQGRNGTIFAIVLMVLAGAIGVTIEKPKILK